VSDERDALDRELNRLLLGGAAPNAADAAVPSELTPLVEAADRLHRLGAIQLSQAARSRTRAAIEAALGTTSVFASSGVLPDSPLYPERNLGEGLQLRLAQTPQERATLNARFASARVSQLHARIQNHAALAGVAMSTLLADVTSRLRAAKHEARAADQGTRDQIRQAEGQIEQQLNQIQHEGDLPANQEQSIGETVKSLQADQNNGQSGDHGNGQSQN
jgi:hypothetical protein